MLQKLIAEAEKEFYEEFCEKDRGLRTRMKAINNISMANGIFRFLTNHITKSYETGKQEVEHRISFEIDRHKEKAIQETHQKLLKEIEELYEMSKDYPEQLRRIGYQDALTSIKKLLI